MVLMAVVRTCAPPADDLTGDTPRVAVRRHHVRPRGRGSHRERRSIDENSSSARSLLGRVLQREAARWWWAPLVAGAVWFVIGWLALRLNATSLTDRWVAARRGLPDRGDQRGGLGALMRGGWAVLHYALAVIFVLGAIWSFVRPINSVFALASVLGLLLFLQGIFTLTRGLALRDESPYWWLDVAAGGLVTRARYLGRPRPTGRGASPSATVFILVWVGFMAIFRGVSDVALAFSLRRLATQDVRSPRRGAPVPQAVLRRGRPSAPTVGGTDDQRRGQGLDRCALATRTTRVSCMPTNRPEAASGLSARSTSATRTGAADGTRRARIPGR